jgi:formamidopyrimidine-DNA glycosylase
MPEGHTIHRLARDVRRRFAGTAVQVSSPQGPFTAGAALLDGARLHSTQAHGKHFFARFDGPPAADLDGTPDAAASRWLHVHLGLFGKVSVGDGPPPPIRGAVRLRMVSPTSWLDLRGPTACRVVTPDEKAALHARLGADPLRPDADPTAAGNAVRRSRRPLGALLLDQHLVAGVGNVYRAEVLFLHGLHPWLPGQALDAARWDALWADLVRLLRAGVRSGRIVTTDPLDRPSRNGARRAGAVRRTDAHYVYRREDAPCRRCGTAIAHDVLAARRIFWCPTCQPYGTPHE